ncbi:MAG TPA: sugar ABC transporter permease [Clostridiales bacterium]|nr:sugar ABC transporter permease [Clostridiales bacterium]
MVLPGALYFLINNYFPMFGMFIAFKNIDYSVGILKSPWVGIDNFKYLFLTQDAFIMTRNTILYNLTFIALGNILGIMVGIMLFELFSGIMKKFFQTTILMPQLISYVIVAYIVYAFLSNEAGFINKTILGDKAVDFYANQFYWPFILVFVNVWKNLGYASIIYLSSILGIDKSLYEAACVDGATKWQQIRKVTLPMLKPTVITLLLMQMGRMFYSDFGLFYQVPMNAGVLFNATQTIDTYVYRALMQLNQIGKASAASVYQSIIGFIVVLAVNALVRKVDRENAMF